MNQLLLSPTDILFFRDGRPMSGASAGHGAAWPLPTVTNAALHAALWRSGLAAQSHAHQRATNKTAAESRSERFGSLVTAGPFPVYGDQTGHTWYFPRPLDADSSKGKDGIHTVKIIACPMKPLAGAASSNPLPLIVGATIPPSKDTPSPWWSEALWADYLGANTDSKTSTYSQAPMLKDNEFSGSESYIGIGISSETGTQNGEQFYSAHYLRLRENWRLGLLAATSEKLADPSRHGERDDLIPKLITDEHHLLVGGQQRLCTATLVTGNSPLPLPLGQRTSFAEYNRKYLVKWILLSPAIFPAINESDKNTTAHSGGWLPTWIRDGGAHEVLLRAPLSPRDVKKESRSAYRARVQQQPSIAARLVAAIVSKPIPVTGWSLGTPDNPDTESREGGAKPTHLAVPAGSVYYFECDSAEAAQQLAAALNWHGDGDGNTIRNRRSSLLGEKGFGIGVCGTWSYLEPEPQATTQPKT